MPDISTVHQHLIGVSFLDSQENNRMYKAWEYRFQPELSVCMQVSPEELKNANGDFMVMKRIVNAVNEQGNQAMDGLNVILAGFLDLCREDAGEQVELLRKLGSRISKVGAILSLNIQFGYVGDIPSPDPTAMQNCVTMIAEKKVGRLCMVGKDAYDESGSRHNWKAAIILLDALRRNPAPDTALPYAGAEAMGKIGFLKYTEFNQKKLDQLLAEKEALNRALGDQGDMEFHASLTELLNTVGTNAEKEFPVNGDAHPIHPGMIVEKGFMGMGWSKAKNGKDKAYNEAAAATAKAVEDTVRHMRSQMMAAYIPDTESAKNQIRKLIQDSGLGAKKVMEMLEKGGNLGIKLEPQGHPNALSLPFQENGCGALIEAHLVESRAYNIYLCKKALLEKLEEAFGQMEAEYRALIPELEKKLKKLTTQLSKVPDWATYTGMVTGNGKKMESCFHPIMGGGDSRKFVLWRESQDGADLNKIASYCCYFIDKKYGNLKNIDDARSKAVHVFFDVCSQESLMDLII